jgi:hypothetical protein
MEFEQMRLLLNDDRLETTLEDVARSVVTPVEVLGIAGVQSMHPPRKRRTSRFQQEVVVVSHQAIRVEEPGLIGDDGGEKIQEMTAIGGVAKDRSPFMAAAGDVVQRSREFQAKGSRHMHSLLRVVMWQVET